MSLEIASVKFKSPDEVSKDRRLEVLRSISEFRVSNEDGIMLIPFGSIITDCCNSTATLDILVDFDSFHQQSCPLGRKLERFKKFAEILAQQVRGELVKSRRSKPANRLRILNALDTTMEITLFFDSACLKRTAYIVAATVLNKWAIPVLRVILAWGRNTSISSGSSDSLLTEEELAIMFFYFTIIKYGQSMSEDVLAMSHNLLMKNHFQTCHLDECIHVEMNENITRLSEELGELCIKSDPVDSHRNLPPAKPEDETLCGQAILGFFRFYGVCRGLALKEVPDPAKIDCGPCLLNLKDLQYIQLGEQMIQAYHALANCSTIDDFVHPNCQEDRRFTMVLPNEVSSLFKYVETGWEDMLTQESGVSFVNIRKKIFRGFKPGHIIEAWGNAEAIRRFKARIHGIIGTAACFTEGNLPQDRLVISEAYRTVLEGASGAESVLNIYPYNGRCQNWHSKRMKQIPVVRDLDPSDAYGVSEVISYFEDQRLFLRKNYNRNVHGGIRVAVSFGNFYTTGFRLGAMKVGAFIRKLSERPSGEKAEHVRNNQAASNSDSGLSLRPGVHANFGPQGNSNRNDLMYYPFYMSGLHNPVFRNPSSYHHSKESANRRFKHQQSYTDSAFIPSNGLDLKRFTDFLRKLNFAETEHRCEYRATVKMDVSSGIIVLNKNLKLTLVHLQDIKWFVLTVSRRRADLDFQPTDIRIRIHSRPVITAAELAEREGCQHLLENAHRLLHRNDTGEVDGIALDEYKGRINYMRYKDMTSFRFRGKTGSLRGDDDDNFLNKITFKLNRGKEYRVPKDGIFTQVTDQMELIMETELPDLEDKEECEEFMREIYEFSKDFARRFVD